MSVKVSVIKYGIFTSRDGNSGWLCKICRMRVSGIANDLFADYQAKFHMLKEHGIDYKS